MDSANDDHKSLPSAATEKIVPISYYPINWLSHKYTNKHVDKHKLWQKESTIM